MNKPFSTERLQTSHCGSTLQYAMRAECQSDCIQLRAVLGAWVTAWREDHVLMTEDDGRSDCLPDMDIAFSLRPDAPALAELRWLFDRVRGCHVAAETLETLANYTGERGHDRLEQTKRRPTDEALQLASASALALTRHLRGVLARTVDTISALEQGLTQDGL